MKRTTVNSPDIGKITNVLNDARKYPEQKAYREIWCKGKAGTDARLLFQMIGERLSDGETEATLTYLLTEEGVPALYMGKSSPDDLTEITSEIKTELVTSSDWYKDNGRNLQNLVGKVVYLPEFFVEQLAEGIQKFDTTDSRDFFAVTLEDAGIGEIQILDNDTVLPPSLYDIASLKPIAKDPAGSYKIAGSYIYKKDIYQRFYGKQYVTGDLVTSKVENVSYSLMPYLIQGVEDLDGVLQLKSIPFIGQLNLQQSLTNGTLIFTDYSFTKLEIDEYAGAYYHKSGAPSDPLWMRLDTDIDPWMDEVFSSGNSLSPATIYTCSCPNYSKSMLRSPQESEDSSTRKINRQRRYPLPTAQGRRDFDQIGLGKAAGAIESWETREDRMSFKMCKHTIAAMFIENLKVKEPNSYPTIDARESFEEKLEADMAEVGEEFISSYRRGGITTLELIFALAQGLNLDEVELAYVLLNSNF